MWTTVQIILLLSLLKYLSLLFKCEIENRDSIWVLDTFKSFSLYPSVNTLTYCQVLLLSLEILWISESGRLVFGPGATAAN